MMPRTWRRRKLDTLTPREREILPYLVSGEANKQIAADLGVVEKTVNVHRTHVMEKTAAVEPRGAGAVRRAAAHRHGPGCARYWING
jgi:FixJ family two-component response regulator